MVLEEYWLMCVGGDTDNGQRGELEGLLPPYRCTVLVSCEVTFLQQSSLLIS